jgi:hypothetical protein
MIKKFNSSLITLAILSIFIIKDIEAASILTKEISLGDTAKSGNSLLGMQVSLKAYIGGVQKCQDRWPQVNSNYGFMCMNLEGRDDSKFDWAFAKIGLVDANQYSKWVANKQTLKITARVEIRENGRLEKVPRLVILKFDPIKELDCEYVSC